MGVPMAKKMLEHLKKKYPKIPHFHKESGRKFNTRNINVAGPKGHGQGWHQDSEGYGRLVFVFVAGNTSENSFRLGGKKSKDEKTRECRSGDCMVFEGQTWHSVKKIKPGTSPFKNKKGWLGSRRMSVLLRQVKPKKVPGKPGFLKKPAKMKGKFFTNVFKKGQ